MQSAKKSSAFVSDSQRQKALAGNTSKTVSQYLSIVQKYFQPLPKPRSGQWLSQHPTAGQTFSAYSTGSHNKITQSRNIIYILPLDHQIEKSFLKTLQNYTECFYYPLKVSILCPPEGFLKGIKSRMNCGVKQYHAGQILDKLKQQLKHDAFCMIAVSITDLYPRESWNYVFGLASLAARVGVFSFARHDDRFYSDKKYEVDYDRIIWRSIGTLVHQIGHMFGLKHCIYYMCIMNGSNGPEQASTKPLELCPVCLKKLQFNIKFDIKQRYQKISEFLKKTSEKLQTKKYIGLYEMINGILSELQKVTVKQEKQPKKTTVSLSRKSIKTKEKIVSHKSMQKEMKKITYIVPKPSKKNEQNK